jgi:hypothetical protein
MLHTFIARAVLLAAGVLPVAAQAQAPFQGSITYRVQVEEMGMSMTMHTKGSRMRTEMEMPGMPAGMVMIMDMDSMVTRVVMQEMGMYMEMDMKALLATAESMLPQSTRDSMAAATADATMESLGTADEIVGIPCRNYRLSNGPDQMEGCIATGLGSLGGLGELPSELAGPLAGMLPSMDQYAKEFPDGMLVLRVRMMRNGAMETTMEVTALERKVLDDALFAIPPGLTRVDPPTH